MAAERLLRSALAVAVDLCSRALTGLINIVTINVVTFTAQGAVSMEQIPLTVELNFF